MCVYMMKVSLYFVSKICELLQLLLYSIFSPSFFFLKIILHNIKKKNQTAATHTHSYDQIYHVSCSRKMLCIFNSELTYVWSVDVDQIYAGCDFFLYVLLELWFYLCLTTQTIFVKRFKVIKCENIETHKIFSRTKCFFFKIVSVFD